MPVLLLALDIAEVAAMADREFDYQAKAAELLALHPEASIGPDAVAEVLREEFFSPRARLRPPLQHSAP